MLLKAGQKILVAHRRLFESDMMRFFAGKVDGYETGIVKATGYSYAWDMVTGEVLEKPEERTKLLSLSSGTLIVYELPDDVALEALTFRREKGALALTDGVGFSMNLAEAAHSGRL